MFSALPDSVNNPLAFCNKNKTISESCKTDKQRKIIFSTKRFLL